jgi:hypothetical protein
MRILKSLMSPKTMSLRGGILKRLCKQKLRLKVGLRRRLRVRNHMLPLKAQATSVGAVAAIPMIAVGIVGTDPPRFRNEVCLSIP